MKENPQGKGWASSANYGNKIVKVLNDVRSTVVNCETEGTASNDPEIPYLVKVDIVNLNIRKGPGINYARTGLFTGIGTFTIVEVRDGEGSKSGWGKLKSGSGWICLDCTKKV